MTPQTSLGSYNRNTYVCCRILPCICLLIFCSSVHVSDALRFRTDSLSLYSFHLVGSRFSFSLYLYVGDNKFYCKHAFSFVKVSTKPFENLRMSLDKFPFKLLQQVINFLFNSLTALKRKQWTNHCSHWQQTSSTIASAQISLGYIYLTECHTGVRSRVTPVVSYRILCKRLGSCQAVVIL
jgi:hypothetical protein